MYKTFFEEKWGEIKIKLKKIREMSTFEEQSQKWGAMRVFEDPWEPCLETSWLKFEIWHVSVSINCNFFRYLNQLSNRNNQPLSFSTSWHGMVWNLVSFFRYPSTDIYEYHSGRTSWSLTALTGPHELY